MTSKARDVLNELEYKHEHRIHVLPQSAQVAILKALAAAGQLRTPGTVEVCSGCHTELTDIKASCASNVSGSVFHKCPLNKFQPITGDK